MYASAPNTSPVSEGPKLEVSSLQKDEAQPTDLPGLGSDDPPKILVVEDDFLIALEIETALLNAGFKVVGPASTADQAVEMAIAQRPILVIMDIRLRGFRDGVDAAIEIFSKTGTRCIFATAHQDPATRKRAELAGPWGWLPKPYATDRLMQMILNVLSKFTTPSKG